MINLNFVKLYYKIPRDEFKIFFKPRTIQATFYQFSYESDMDLIIWVEQLPVTFQVLKIC